MKHRFHLNSDMEFPSYCDYAQSELQDRVTALDFPLEGLLFLNGQLNTQNEGKHDEWKYKGSFTKNKQRNVLLHCKARFTEIGKQHSIYIPIPKSIRESRLIRDLIRHMGKNQMEPEEEPNIDGRDHGYNAYVNGKHKKARYCAHWEPFGDEGPKLICSYGLIEGNAEFTYSSDEK